MIGLITKAILAAAVASSGAIITALQNGRISWEEWVAIVISFLVALGAVWAIPNLPDGVRAYGKAVTAGLIAALGALGTAMLNGVVSPDEIVVIVAALITGSGLVYIAPNAPASMTFRPQST